MNGLEEYVTRFSLAAAHLLWVVAVLWLLVYLVERLLVRSAAAKHGVHMLGLLAALVALPVCVMLSDAPEVKSSDPVLVKPAQQTVEVYSEVTYPLTEAATEEEELTSGAPPTMSEDAVNTAQTSVGEKVVMSSSEPAPVWQKIGPWVAYSYLLGLVVMILRLVFGWVGTARLRKRAEPITGGLWMESLDKMSAWFGRKGKVMIAWSQDVAAPVVMGFLKPVILVPVALASRLSPAQVEAVIAHELAHLKRRDHWAVLVQRLAETFLFFHPGVWWMSRRMEALREEACDDIVVQAECDPTDYAEALVICSEFRSERAGLLARFGERLAATGKDKASLRQRVLRLLGQNDQEPVQLGRVGWVIGIMALAGMVSVFAFGGLNPDEVLDDESTELLKKSMEEFRDDWDSTLERMPKHIEGQQVYCIIDLERKRIELVRNGKVIPDLELVELPASYNYSIQHAVLLADERRLVPMGSLEAPVVLKLPQLGAPDYHEEFWVVGRHPEDNFNISLSPGGWGFSSPAHLIGYETGDRKHDEGGRTMLVKGGKRQQVLDQWEQARVGLPEISEDDEERLAALFERHRAGRLMEKEFLQEVNRMGPEVVDGLMPYLDTGKTDQLAMKAIQEFGDNQMALAYLREELEELSGQPGHIHPNRRHCCLVMLGQAGDETDVDLIAGFLEDKTLASLAALGMIGGERAAAQLVKAFEFLPGEDWWLIASNLERAGDPSVVPELKRRLAMVEAPPTERFSNNAVAVFIRVIRKLSPEDDGDGEPHNLVWQQGHHFVYPYDGSGSPKSFSVHPPRDHYVRFPEVDATTDSGRAAIWQAFREKTDGPGFTIDDQEIVLFNGLKAMPLWENGAPYPTTMYDWLMRSSHRDLHEKAQRDARNGRVLIPDHGQLLGLDPSGRMYRISLKRTSEDATYHVGVQELDPLRRLVQPSPLANGPFTDWTGMTLYDLESGRENGAVDLHRRYSVHLEEKLFREPSQNAILTMDFAKGGMGIGVPGAEEFVLVEAEPDLGADELVRRLAEARKEPPVIDDHEIIDRDSWRGHVFKRLEKGRCFGFAIRMPTGIPLAGLLVIREVDNESQTLKARRCMLFTRYARQVFDPDALAAPTRFIGKLANGLSLEMLGVGQSPSTGKSWWRADGSPLHEAPYFRIDGGAAMPKPGDLGRELALEETWGDVHFSSTAARWEITPNKGWGGHTGRDENGNLLLESEDRNGRHYRVREVHGFFANLPEDTVTIRREYATGEYVERASWSADGTITHSAEDESQFQLSAPVEGKGGVLVTVENVPMDHICQLIHVGPDGSEARFSDISGSYRAGEETQTLRFRDPGLEFSDIVELRLESRSFDQWIEFRNVSLQPGKNTKVEVVTSDMVDSGHSSKSGNSRRLSHIPGKLAARIEEKFGKQCAVYRFDREEIGDREYAHIALKLVKGEESIELGVSAKEPEKFAKYTALVVAVNEKGSWIEQWHDEDFSGLRWDIPEKIADELKTLRWNEGSSGFQLTKENVQQELGQTDNGWRLVVEFFPYVPPMWASKEKDKTATLIIGKERGGRITPEGVVYSLDYEVVALEKLAERLKQRAAGQPDLELLIRCDPELPFSRVVGAMNAAEVAGIENVRFASGKTAGVKKPEKVKGEVVMTCQIPGPEKRYVLSPKALDIFEVVIAKDPDSEVDGAIGLLPSAFLEWQGDQYAIEKDEVIFMGDQTKHWKATGIQKALIDASEVEQNGNNDPSPEESQENVSGSKEQASLEPASYVEIEDGQALDFDGGEIRVLDQKVNGVDAVIDQFVLIGKGLEAVIVDLPHEVESERLEKGHLEELLELNKYRTGRWPLRPEGKPTGHEIIFRTENGTLGALSLVGHTTSASGVASRYRVKIRRVMNHAEISAREANDDRSVPDEIAKPLQNLFDKYYPEARFSNDPKNGLRVEFKVRDFHFPEPESDAKKFTSRDRGPMEGGILCEIDYEPGRYAGAAEVGPTSATFMGRGVYRIVLMAPYSESRDAHLWARLSYPPDVDGDFIEKYLEIVGAFSDAE